MIAVLITEALEWAEARWGKSRKRPFDLSALGTQVLPKVSIHVPAYNEPPEMLIETLDALARLDYPDFEVIVIDNNTRRDPPCGNRWSGIAGTWASASSSITSRH